jgi:hypothetical protein
MGEGDLPIPLSASQRTDSSQHNSKTLRHSGNVPPINARDATGVDGNYSAHGGLRVGGRKPQHIGMFVGYDEVCWSEDTTQTGEAV